MTAQISIIETTDAQRWLEVLQACATHDVYHLAQYHRLEEERGEGQARLFVYKEEGACIAFPMLLRSIQDLPGVSANGYRDVGSVYGYSGPVVGPRELPEGVTPRFQAALRDYFEQERVVAAFARLHPSIDQGSLLTVVGGEIVTLGESVYLDLTEPEHEQRRHYRSNHRRDINTARRAGVECVWDRDWKYLEAFCDIYEETMRRVDANDEYFFGRQYFQSLRQLLGDAAHLFVALKDGEVICATIFTTTGSVVQYHLGGTLTEHLKLSPLKLMFDDVSRWARERGLRSFHIGGGVGVKEDSLFHYKAGFSPHRWPGRQWRCVLQPRVHAGLKEQIQAWNDAHGLEPASANYFPAYRVPTRPIGANGPTRVRPSKGLHAWAPGHGGSPGTCWTGSSRNEDAANVSDVEG